MFDFLLDIIYPRRCPICTEIVRQNGELICQECREKLFYIEGFTCLKCGKPIDVEEQEYCFDCVKNKHHYTKGYGIWVYKGAIRKSLANFKYHNKREFAKFYAQELVHKYGEEISNLKVDAMVPIPIHKHKKAIRGYNQADVLARELGKILKVPVISNLLIRVKDTQPQKELNDKQRQKNLEGAFSISEKEKYKFSKKLKKILLIDDIYTTGSTIEACTNVLMQYGVEEVYFICICIGKGY